VQVTFDMDRSGMLHVTAVERETAKTLELQVQTRWPMGIDADRYRREVLDPARQATVRPTTWSRATSCPNR
jgi:molecular chaperone DnaK (HSP70)